MSRFEKGNVVTIRDEHEPARIVNVFDTEDGIWYEIEAINLSNVHHREVKESDLRLAHRIVDFDDETDWRYFDKDWNEFHEGDFIRQPDGSEHRLYRTTNHRLGVDATNPKWIESGRAVPCQFGIYPLNHDDVTYGIRIKEG